MTEQGFAACLAAVLNGECELNESFDPDGVHDAVPYDEAGVLTRNAGLVVRMDDGSQFQITAPHQGFEPVTRWLTGPTSHHLPVDEGFRTVFQRI